MNLRCSRLMHIGLVLPLMAGCTAGRPEWVAVGHRGMVATDSPYASQIGLDVLKAGGNAIDAATAVSFALAVTRPESTGLGGGGFAIFRLADSGKVHVFDFRETAPAASAPDMYAQTPEQEVATAAFTRTGSGGQAAGGTRSPRPEPSRYGHLVVGVPGLVAGRTAMQQRFGTKSLAELIEPAIHLAREGFEVDEHYVESCKTVLKVYEAHPELTRTCRYVYRKHLRAGDLRDPGDKLAQPELARLLEAIARDGADVFYQGTVADALALEMQRSGGIITREDLASYRVAEREPIIASYRDYELILMPPPSSGGVCLAEALNILETLDLPMIEERDPATAMHYVIEALKHAFADRARWLGDADFSNIPVKLLTGKPYARVLAGGLSADVTHDNQDAYGHVAPPDDDGTSHFCIVDRWGNVVVSTETVNTSFGSLAALDEWGLILNSEMDDFTANPGVPNAYGLTQSARNAIAPYKRPLSSMSPTIVLKNGEPVLLLGASGGPRIITSVLNVLLGVLDYGMSLEDAMAALRVHHQFQPDEVAFNRPPPSPLADALQSKGHHLSDRKKTGSVQAIRITGSQLIGTSDPNKGGKPAGY